MDIGLICSPWLYLFAFQSLYCTLLSPTLHGHECYCSVTHGRKTLPLAGFTPADISPWQISFFTCSNLQNVILAQDVTKSDLLLMELLENQGYFSKILPDLHKFLPSAYCPGNAPFLQQAVITTFSQVNMHISINTSLYYNIDNLLSDL